MSTRTLGRWGEEVAAQHLRARGYRLLARNWHCVEGELDLVALQGDMVVFVEVKARRSDAFGAPEEALTTVKQRRLLRAAWAYLEQHGLTDRAWRVDVVAVEGSPRQGVNRLEHYENAVEADPDLFS